MQQSEITKIVSIALAEDIGTGDLTAHLIPPERNSKATLICQQNAVLCGVDFVNEVFFQLDPRIQIEWHLKDGAEMASNQTICEFSGSSRSLLTGERTALNFLQVLSSTATLTKKYVEEIKGTRAQLLDTRKTLPGLRNAQKYAVTCGGGRNHRFGLFDQILIKENHIAASESITSIITQAKNMFPQKILEIEVRNLDEFRQALAATPDIILLDNFSLASIREAVIINNGKSKLEVSGGVNLETIRAIAETGVDYISVGAITKSVIPIELSMIFAN